MGARGRGRVICLVSGVCPRGVYARMRLLELSIVRVCEGQLYRERTAPPLSGESRLYFLREIEGARWRRHAIHADAE